MLLSDRYNKFNGERRYEREDPERPHYEEDIEEERKVVLREEGTRRNELVIEWGLKKKYLKCLNRLRGIGVHVSRASSVTQNTLVYFTEKEN